MQGRIELGLLEKAADSFYPLRSHSSHADLATPGNVRFLVENAGSMVDLHYQAFCTLVGIPSEPKNAYLWDPADHGFGINEEAEFL